MEMTNVAGIAKIILSSGHSQIGDYLYSTN